MHKLNLAGLCLSVLCAASACSSQTDPNKLKDQITGDAKGTAHVNGQCALFTQAEVAAYVGMPVGPGENTSGGAGCRWSSEGFEAWATIAVVSPDYFPEPSGVDGFKRWPAMGERAWVAPDSGWSAGAVDSDAAIVVVIYGKKASEAAAISLLQNAIQRRTK